MHRTTTGLLAALALLLAGWVVAPPAAACSCAGLPTAAEAFDRADAVFTGRLLTREVAGGSSSSDPALHVFAVDAVWKGSVHAEQGVVSAASGASCGLELTGTGPFVVFAIREPGDLLSANLCGGTAPRTPELAAELRALTGPDAREPAPGAAGTELPGGLPGWGVGLGLAALALLGTAGGIALRRRARAR